MRNRIVSRTPARAALQPSPALLGFVSNAFNLGVPLARKTTMQLVTATQHGQAARLPR
jgi:hypothetical protein